MKKLLLLVAGFFCFHVALQAQQQFEILLDGAVYTAFVTENNDTMIMTDIDQIQVTSPRSFKSKEDWRRFRKYQRYAAIVYPYAMQAIMLFRDIEEETEGLKKRKRKKYVKKIHKRLKKEFNDPLKNLTKTQGYILVKMIEKEIERPLYDIIKDYRGSWTAMTWNMKGSLFGMHIKDGYVVGQDELLDIVLQDYNFDEDIENLD